MKADDGALALSEGYDPKPVGVSFECSEAANATESAVDRLENAGAMYPESQAEK